MSGREQDQDRGARLAEALRENLRRRKAQARGRRDQEGRDQEGRDQEGRDQDGRDQDGRGPEPETASEIDEGQAAGGGPRD